MNPSVDLLTLSDAGHMAETVAGQWLDEVAAARRQGLPHLVALTGGRSAGKFFDAVVTQNRERAISFEHVHFFWGDERCVPATDPESNYRVAAELLLAPLKIAPHQIHRLKGEADPETAAREASAELSSVAPANSASQPVLDLVFLGMGEDGHVASLFPNAGADVLNCTTPFLVIRNSPKPPPTRISLSYATLTAAKKIWVWAIGASKESALRNTLTTGQTPLGRVMASHPGIKIFTDLNISADLPKPI
jgi:6-phosphogluconolactonase